jgi:predicted lipid-binding transport protein (Tim44 family)
VKTTTLITTAIMVSLIGAPTVSFAKARGGGGGYTSGSRGSGGSGSMGSRGSRTYDQNGSRPIERSITPAPPANPSQATAPRAATAPAAQPAPAMQPSFLQRHPLLAGIAGGVAGSWIGHLLFGATDSSARVSEESRDHDGEGPTGSSSSPGLLILLMLLGGGALYYFMRVRRTAEPDFSGMTRGALPDAGLDRPSAGGVHGQALETAVTPTDEAAFRQIVIDVQTTWGKGDLAGLRKLVTPEMLHYFSTGLSENTSQDVENRVADVRVTQADVREAWTEDATQYATVSLRWASRDYTVSLAKRPGESGYVVEGDEHASRETMETWTFMRYRNGKWLLSAIQQVE